VQLARFSLITQGRRTLHSFRFDWTTNQRLRRERLGYLPVPLHEPGYRVFDPRSTKSIGRHGLARTVRCRFLVPEIRRTPDTLDLSARLYFGPIRCSLVHRTTFIPAAIHLQSANTTASFIKLGHEMRHN